jgi:hypothetical protein
MHANHLHHHLNKVDTKSDTAHVVGVVELLPANNHGKLSKEDVSFLVVH